MSIVLRQPGEAAAAAKAGAMIGNAQKRAMEWEFEKMQMRSQQDFQHELQLRQIELDKIAGARQWDVEKMKIRSQIDFEKDERERVEEEQQFKNIIKAIDETDWLSKEEKKKRKFVASMEHMGAPSAAKYLGGKQYGPEPHWRHPDVINTPYGQAMQAKAIQGRDGLTPAQMMSATKVLSEMPGEPGWTRRQISKIPVGGAIADWMYPAGPTPEQAVVRDYLQAQIAKTAQLQTETVEVPTEEKYEVGQVITRAGKHWQITGFDTDGTPLVEEVK